MFDYDGVIVDSGDVFSTTFLAAFRAYGYAGITTREQLMKLLDGNFYEALTQLGLSSHTVDNILADAFERKMREPVAEIRSFRGMQESLKVLSHRNVLTVITSNVSESVRRILEKEDIRCFDEIVGAETEKSKVKKIQKTMSRYQDLPAYYVGDTKGDMIEGREAGAATVAVTWGWHTHEKLSEAAPDYMVHTPAELATLLSR